MTNKIFILLAIIIFIGTVFYFRAGGEADVVLPSDKNENAEIGQSASDIIQTENAAIGDEIIFYYGESCPHCHDVLKFLDDNKITEKVVFAKKEVNSNKENSAELVRRAKECDLDASKIGVPFLYARGKCYIGAPNVEAFFQEEAGK